MENVLETLVGTIGSVVIAWITTRDRTPHGAETQKIMGAKTSFWAVLALGLALTGLVVGVFSFTETTNAQVQVVQKTYTAHTEGYRHDNANPPLLAPRVPAPDQRHVLTIPCPEGYHPITAWHEVKGSYPSIDAMYTVDANVENKEVVLYLRAREGVDGYAYLDVIVLCSRVGS
jgi:hypothetical protein